MNLLNGSLKYLLLKRKDKLVTISNRLPKDKDKELKLTFQY